MVDNRRNRIQFGNGDVNVMVSMTGTMSEPQAVIIFQNRKPTAIGKYDENADLSRTKKGIYDPVKDFAMLFSRPESIDCVISALQAAKRAAFGENNVRSAYLGGRSER